MVNICLDEPSSKGKVCLGNPFGGFGLKVKKNNLQKQTGRLTLRINKFLIIN